MKFINLGSIVKISKGKKPSTVTNIASDNLVRFIQIDDLRNDNNLKYTDHSGVAVNLEDIIIAWDGANAGTIGYGIEGIIGSTLAKLEIVDSNFTPSYIGRYLKSKSKYLRDRCTGATIPHISGSVLRTLRVPIISIKEQEIIVKYLEQADRLLNNRKKAIDLLDEYLKSTFHEMFGDNSPELSKWPVVKLESLTKAGKSSMRTGPFGSDLKHSEFVDSGIAVIGIDNAVHNKFAWDKRRYISEEKYRKLKRYTLYPRDVIITIMATTGRSAVVPDDMPLSINTKHLAAITLDSNKANPYYISYSIHSDPRIMRQIEGKSRGAIMPGLNLGIIKNLEINLPPVELQNRFVEILQNIEILKKKMSSQLDDLDNQFQALIQKAFNYEN